MDKPWKVIFAFVGVFIAGAIFGGLFTLRASAKLFAYEERSQRSQPPPTKARPPGQAPQATAKAQPVPAQPPRPISVVLMRQISLRVNPTPEQMKRIRIVCARAADDLMRLYRDSQLDQRRVMDRMYEDAAEVLSPEQRGQLEKLRQEFLEKERRDREKRGELAAKASAARAAGKAGPPEGSNPPAKD